MSSVLNGAAAGSDGPGEFVQRRRCRYYYYFFSKFHSSRSILFKEFDGNSCLFERRIENLPISFAEFVRGVRSGSRTDR